MLHKIAGLALVLLGAGVASPIVPQSFSFTGLLNRFVTPNGDGKNDNAVFLYDNPSDSMGSINIYELRGHKVATVSIEPGCTSGCTTTWSPQSSANGIYIYVVTIDQTSKYGVLVVVR